MLRVATAPCFLATKLEAFAQRGHRDYYASKDIEDFVAVVHGRRELVHEIRRSPSDLQRYLSEQVKVLLSQRDLSAILEGHLPGEDVGRSIGRLRDLASIA